MLSVYEVYEAGTLPQNALGKGPCDTAYRHFLLWQCRQIATEITAVFHSLSHSTLIPKKYNW
jgi:hypothetical protein